VDIDGEMVADIKAGSLNHAVTETIDQISVFCGVDIFLLGPKLTPIVDGVNGDVEVRRDQRWRVAIYGDILSSEHAKTRILVSIDQWVWLTTNNLFRGRSGLTRAAGSHR
jgi:hypothetical protein